MRQNALCTQPLVETQHRWRAGQQAWSLPRDPRTEGRRKVGRWPLGPPMPPLMTNTLGAKAPPHPNKLCWRRGNTSHAACIAANEVARRTLRPTPKQEQYDLNMQACARIQGTSRAQPPIGRDPGPRAWKGPSRYPTDNGSVAHPWGGNAPMATHPMRPEGAALPDLQRACSRTDRSHIHRGAPPNAQGGACRTRQGEHRESHKGHPQTTCIMHKLLLRPASTSKSLARRRHRCGRRQARRPP